MVDFCGEIFIRIGCCFNEIYNNVWRWFWVLVVGGKVIVIGVCRSGDSCVVEYSIKMFFVVVYKVGNVVNKFVFLSEKIEK